MSLSHLHSIFVVLIHIKRVSKLLAVLSLREEALLLFLLLPKVALVATSSVHMIKRFLFHHMEVAWVWLLICLVIWPTIRRIYPRYVPRRLVMILGKRIILFHGVHLL